MTTSEHMGADAPVVDFDHHSPEFAKNLEKIVRDLQRDHPISYTPKNDGHYIVSSHPLAKQILSDTATFSSARDAEGQGGTFIPSFQLPLPGAGLLPAETDPPVHAALRRALGPYFNRPAVERLRPGIEELVTKALDDLETKPEFDIITDIGHLVGPITVLGYLGLPLERRKFFIEAIRTGYQLKLGDDMDLSQLLEMAGEVFKVVVARREEPQEDLASYLAQSQDPVFDDVEIVSLLMTLALGGIETTESLIANSLWYLDEDREVRQQLIDDPSLIPNAIDEFLRIFSPAPTLGRTVTRDITLDGVSFNAGDRVMVLLAAGNMCPHVFEDPDQVKVERNCAQSITFGWGPHRCLGARLSQVEVTIVLTEILRRVPNYSIHRDRAQRYGDRSAVNGWVTMPASTNL
jgi:cytochrome P450